MATVTPAAAAHYTRIQALQAMAIESSRRAWSNIDRRYITESWQQVTAVALAPAMTQILSSAAEAGAEYGVLDMAQRGTYVQPDTFVAPRTIASTAPSGVPLQTALAAPASRALALIGGGATTAQALAGARSLLDGMSRTFVSDASRLAGSVDITTRPAVGYVRMLNPPSCDSCTILAGKFYRWNKGFLRHPKCDCIHRPVASLDAAKAEGLIDDPYEYFNSLSEDEQNKAFGAAKAQAIRDGGDIYRVQNSWRGRDGLYTSEGTTRRGFASDLPGARLTPDGIYRTAANRTEALQLLEQHGYVLPAGQVAGGSIIGANYQGYGALGRGGTRVAASNAVRDAQITGVRDPASRYTATEAERRVIDARARYDAALAGENPFGDGPATPEIKARAELEYRRWLSSAGEIYTS